MSRDSDQLILDHMDLVHRLAREIAGQLPAQVDLEELAAFGRVGLVQAARRFDPTRAASFATFARYRIRGEMFDGIRKMAWLPPRARRWLDVQEGVDWVAQDAAGDDRRGPAPRPAHSGHGETPRVGDGSESADPFGEQDQVADRTGSAHDRTTFVEAIRSIGAVFLLSAASDAEGEPIEPVDARTPIDNAVSRDQVARLRSALDRLPDADRALLRKHYYEHVSFSEVARQLGVDKSTISRRHADALRRLREVMTDTESADAPAFADWMGGPVLEGDGPQAIRMPA